MQAVILSAGIGSRLRPLTSLVPKCLVAVAGKPILDYQLKACSSTGLTDITLVVGYKPALIKDYLTNHSKYETTNNMYSLYLAKHLVHSDFILLNGDILLEPSTLQEIVESPSKDAIAVRRGVYNEESMKVTLDRETRLITDISKTIPQNYTFGLALDLYKFSYQSALLLFGDIEWFVR